eukprot:6214613-Pleurochrysis_carterae.AAC.1
MEQPPNLEQNMKEIQRRRQSCIERTEGEAANSEEIQTFKEIDFTSITQYQHLSVLFSISHAEIPPLSCEIDNPGFKIYGLFADDDAAREYASLIKTSDSLFLHPLLKWGVMAHSIPRLLHKEWCGEHVDALRLKNTQRIDEHRQSFHANKLVEIDKKCTGSNDNYHPTRASDACVFEHKNKLRSLKKTSGMSHVQPLPGQRYAVVSFLPDTITPEIPEPLFLVYAAFDTEDEAKMWIEQNLLSLVRDVDIDIVMVCQWLHPQHVTSKNVQNEKFRDEELNRVMQHKREEPNKVKTYTQWLDETGGVKKQEPCVN